MSRTDQSGPTTPKLKNDPKTIAAANVIRRYLATVPQRLLVVGCGSGLEAATLSNEFRCEVHGVDVKNRFDPVAEHYAHLSVASAMALPYADATFDFVYSYHALEHIRDPVVALQEIGRVLKTGGAYCIGTPNRDRLIGYLGSKTATFSQKVRWNIKDWKARLAGQFRNEAGAHAGFTAQELDQMLTLSLSQARNVSRDYYDELYPSSRAMGSLLDFIHCSKYVYPSVYFVGIRN